MGPGCSEKSATKPIQRHIWDQIQNCPILRDLCWSVVVRIKAVSGLSGWQRKPSLADPDWPRPDPPEGTSKSPWCSSLHLLRSLHHLGQQLQVTSLTKSQQEQHKRVFPTACDWRYCCLHLPGSSSRLLASTITWQQQRLFGRCFPSTTTTS